MAAKTADTGSVKRPVKMDYSVTYRENDKLGVTLDERLVSLKRSAYRMMTDKDEELETARADADRILKLKEAVRQREEGEPPLAILCQSAHVRSRKTSEVSSNGRKVSGVSQGGRKISTASGRRMSSAPGPSGRKTSVIVNMPSVTGNGEEGEEGSVRDQPGHSGSNMPDMTRMTLTERRLVMERERFSAKNLFNNRGRRATLTSEQAFRLQDTTPDSARTDTTTAPHHSSQAPGHQGRPQTSPGTRSTAKSRSHMRPASGQPWDGQDDGYGKPPRRPRSRRELRKLVELKIDPFEEEEDGVDKVDGLTGEARRQQGLLHRLQAEQAQLQARVAQFLATMEQFNRRQNRSGLHHIMDTA